MEKVLSIIDFIEENISEDINLKDIADFSGFSLFYFIKFFNKATHLTPFDYLIRRRLTLAAEEIISTKNQIGEISSKYMFKNHETFSRSFKRMFLVSPSKIRDSINYLNFVLYRCDKFNYEILSMIQELKLESEIKYFDEMHLFGVSNQIITNIENLFSYKNYFHEMEKILFLKCKKERINFSDKEIYLVSDIFPHAFTIVKSISLGIKNDKKLYKPEIFTKKYLKKRKCLCFDFEGPIEELSVVLKYIHQILLSCSEYILRVPLQIIKIEKSTKPECFSKKITLFLPIEDR